MEKRTFPVCQTEHIDAAHERFILDNIPDEDAAVDAAEVFQQLSDSTRVRLLSMLALEDMCVCEMADILGMSQPAVSHHLRSLRQCGVVRFKKTGKRAVYSISDTRTGHMLRHLLHDITSGNLIPCKVCQFQNNKFEGEAQQ